VTRLAAVQLELDPSPHILLVEIAEDYVELDFKHASTSSAMSH
jgi:hypothetical protein